MAFIETLLFEGLYGPTVFLNYNDQLCKYCYKTENAVPKIINKSLKKY